MRSGISVARQGMPVPTLMPISNSRFSVALSPVGVGSLGGVLHPAGRRPKNLSNPLGGLANLPHQMSHLRYLDAGGDY